MPEMLMVSSGPKLFPAFESALEKYDFQINRVKSGEEAEALTSRSSPDLVVIDGDLADMTGFECARMLIRVNAMVNCAVISGDSPDAFHEAGEGLGILMQLPPAPGAADAEELIACYTKIRKPLIS
ncbi:MAG: response regulator [Desulfobacteraceae bacterium]|nr:response regulator [Desulfobacteraceae bacterium]